jgi:hypothetical protein
MARLTAALVRPLPLRGSGGLKLVPSLEGVLEKLRELRPIRIPQAGLFDRQGGELGALLLDFLLVILDDSLDPAGHDNQSASEMPAGGLHITDGFCLRCNRDSSCCQRLSRAKVRGRLSRPLDAYNQFTALLLPLEGVEIDQCRLVLKFFRLGVKLFFLHASFSTM